MYIITYNRNMVVTIISFSEFRANLAKHLDQADADKKEVIVTRRNKTPVAVMPLSELESLRETLYLLSTPANAERLLGAVAELDAERGVERELAKP